MHSPSTWSGAVEPAVLAGAGWSGPTLWVRGGGSARVGTRAVTTGPLCLLPLAAVPGVHGVLPAGSALLFAAIAAPGREERMTAGPRRPPRRAPCGRRGPGGVLWWSA
ncbi:hypothetical protein ACIRRH_17625 [Kitasatospora sp. NPDC101235]|uniref:hypothetical protein n=1 Tax=Kitasatospora sp. NPDC101235 TaxID=3364101 RepID=UPI0037F9613A